MSGSPRIKLSVRGVSKTFGKVTALHPSDIELREGEFLTLLGPSGSGKTTLLMLVAGLHMPDSGEILIDGAVSTYKPTSARDIGMVFQSYALFPHLSVYENIAFPLRMRHVAEAEIRRKVMAALETVSLPDVAGRLPNALSGGQQQRIALARCIVYRPSIILMDEPLSALDRKLREQLQREIRRLHKTLGTTVLFVTHDQEEALTMSDRICVMSNGRVEQMGTPEEVYARPSTLFVADFLGESNILDAICRASAGGFNDFVPADMPDSVIRLSGAPLAPGARAKIMIRPEHLRFLPEPPDANSLAATVEDRSFVGASTRYVLQHAGGRVVSLTALTAAGDTMPKPGDRVIVGWDADGATVIPESIAVP